MKIVRRVDILVDGDIYKIEFFIEAGGVAESYAQKACEDIAKFLHTQHEDLSEVMEHYGTRVTRKYIDSGSRWWLALAVALLLLSVVVVVLGRR